MGIISFLEGERFMKKNLAIAVIAIASMYLLACASVFIPKRGFSEVAAEVMISVVILLIGGILLFVDMRCGKGEKTSFDARKRF